MQKIEIEITNDENIGILSEEKIEQIREVFKALVQTGGLTGVKGGQTIIHWDEDGNFRGVELAYWTWRART